jgi:hypothetical protein
MARTAQVTHSMLKFAGMKGFTWRDLAPISVLFLVFLWVVDWTKQYQRDNAPVSEYFEVTQLAVPNHVVGQNPVIAYERFIRKEFSGDWRGEIQDLTTLEQICSNAGTWQYDHDAQMPEGGYTLDWFMDKQCHLPVGTYRLQSCWDVHRVDAKSVTFCRTTDPFTVFDPQTLIEQGKAQ